MHHFVKQEIELQYSQFIGGIARRIPWKIFLRNWTEWFPIFIPLFHCVQYWFFSHIVHLDTFTDIEEKSPIHRNILWQKLCHFSFQSQAAYTLWFAHNYLTWGSFLWHDPHWSQLDNWQKKALTFYNQKKNIIHEWKCKFVKNMQCWNIGVRFHRQ